MHTEKVDELIDALCDRIKGTMNARADDAVASSIKALVDLIAARAMMAD